jgi:hypothetical protein
MNEPQLSEPADKAPTDPRARLLRDGVVLQLKLVVDGLRDAALIPLGLLSMVLGLLRGGEDAGRELQQVIKLGRRSERWINLFGHETHPRQARPGGSLDQLLDRVEAVVMEQHSKGSNSDEARAAIKAVLDESTAEGASKKDAMPDES